MPRVRGRSSPSPALPAIVAHGLASPARPLDPATAGFMKARFGWDFSQVRVHADDRAAASASALGSSAYTVGSDVVFARGAFAPQTREGRRLLAHELAHVVQQRGLPTASPTSPPMQLEDSRGPAEAEADAAADAAHGGGRTRTQLRRVASGRDGRPAVARKADPAKVARMDQAAIRADPDYIENHLVRMEFFGAEQARLHYADGAKLLIGLVPRWIQAPLETVDYHTATFGYARVDGGSELKFIKDPMNLPAEGMSYAEVLKTFTTTVRFAVEPTSGKIVPNHLNTLTAPYLCAQLANSEAEYVRQFNEVAEGTVKILKVQKLIVELMLMRAMMGGPKTPTPRGPVGAAAGAGEAGAAELTASQGGRIIGWGTGQTAEAVAQTQAVARGLTTEAVEGMVARGLTRQWVQEQLALYERAIAAGGPKLKNLQLLPRLELMKKLLELWPK
jgi:hypothetical protein